MPLWLHDFCCKPHSSAASGMVCCARPQNFLSVQTTFLTSVRCLSDLVWLCICSALTLNTGRSELSTPRSLASDIISAKHIILQPKPPAVLYMLVLASKITRCQQGLNNSMDSTTIQQDVACNENICYRKGWDVVNPEPTAPKLFFISQQHSTSTKNLPLTMYDCCRLPTKGHYAAYSLSKLMTWHQVDDHIHT